MNYSYFIQKFFNFLILNLKKEHFNYFKIFFIVFIEKLIYLQKIYTIFFIIKIIIYNQLFNPDSETHSGDLLLSIFEFIDLLLKLL